VTDLELQVTIVRRCDAVEVRAAGEADVASVHVLESALRDALESGVRTVLVDCGALSYLDSSGVRCLVNAATDAEARECRVIVRDASPIVRRVLEITKVDHLLCDDAPDEDGRRGAG
jgi:anti-anti-sigma factor